MAKTIFITGTTGYIGGTVLAIALRVLKENKEPVTVRALVRSEDKAHAVEKWAKDRDFNLIPVVGTTANKEIVCQEVSHSDIILSCADADDLQFAQYLTEGLSTAIERGHHPVIIHTSGTNLLTDGSFGMKPSNKIYHDDKDEEIASIPDSAPHRNVDLHLLNYHSEQRDKCDLAIIAPPTIWGVGRGPGSIYSQQIPHLIGIALKHKQAYNVGKGLNVWTEINCVDLAKFYALLLVNMIKNPGKHNGFYWCEGGEFDWHEVGTQIQQGLIDAGITTQKNANALDTVPDSDQFGQVFFDKDEYDYNNIIGGNSRVRANRARNELGWEPVYSSREQFFDYITNEVMLLSRYG